MQNLIIKEKTGFSTILTFEIFDLNGNIFYADYFTKKISKGERLIFNIPPGKYLYNGMFQKLNEPVKHELIKLPKPDRNRTVKNYKIIFGTNKNKCTIFYDSGKILFDNYFRKAPKYVLYFIYYHELGHHKYSVEKFADMYAYNKMIEFGFNPSQVKRAPVVSLSNKSFERKTNIEKQ